MNKSLIALLFALPILSFGFDTSVKGFIALSALDYQKIEGRTGGPVIGIGVLDLKVFAEQDNMSAALKLDLDGKLSDDYNIFEEAYASYRGIPGMRFSVGKGVVKFQNLHWGAVQNTYLDGGTLLGTENSWRKLSKKAFASVSYGGKSKGFLNTFWIWGDSVENQYDEQGKLKYATTTNVKAYQTNAVKAFNTNLQTGLANKIEIYHFGDLTITQGLALYKKKNLNNVSWAVDFGLLYENSSIEAWADLLAGHTSKLPFDQYTTYSNNEIFLQVGADYNLNESWSFVNNAEIVYNENRSWVYTSTPEGYSIDKSLTEKSGQFVKTMNFKLESGLKYKLSKTSFITTGVLYERKNSEKNGIKNLSYIPGVYNANRSAYEAISSVSFWF